MSLKLPLPQAASQKGDRRKPGVSHKEGDKRLKENRSPDYKHPQTGKPQTVAQKFAGEINMMQMRIRGGASIKNLSFLSIPPELAARMSSKSLLEFKNIQKQCYHIGEMLNDLANHLRSWNQEKYPDLPMSAKIKRRRKIQNLMDAERFEEITDADVRFMMTGSRPIKRKTGK